MTPARASGRKSARQVREQPTAPPVVLLDTNIIVDVLLLRQPWHLDAARLFEAIDAGRVRAFVAVHTVTTIFYLVRRALDVGRARVAVRRLLMSLEIAPLDGADLLRAVSLPLAEFEDSFQVVSAERAGAEAIVTRDRAHFRGSHVSILTPAQLVARLDGSARG